jgi:predicted membrane protein
MSAPGRHRGQHRIVFGALVILVGVLALLDNLRVFDAREVIHFWPMVFVVFGVLKLYQSRDAGGYVLGGALVAAGIGATLQNMGIITIRWRDWWPLLLIVGGAVIIAAGTLGRKPDGGVGVVPMEKLAGSESSIDAGAFMSGINVTNDAQDFRGGKLSAVLGGVELDLRQASIRDTATLSVFTLMGGIVIKVPQDWSIAVNCSPVLGGVDSKAVPPANPSKRLLIHGFVIMGGIEIKN